MFPCIWSSRRSKKKTAHTCGAERQTLIPVISRCMHAPKAEIMSEVGGLYLLLTATVQEKSVGFRMGYALRILWRVYIAPSAIWTDQGNFSPVQVIPTINGIEMFLTWSNKVNYLFDLCFAP